MPTTEPIDLVRHRDALRAGDLAFRTMRFDRPHEASMLRELSATWAAYLLAYERLANRGSGAAELSRARELQGNVLRLADDGVAAEANPGLAVVDDPTASGSNTGASSGWPLVQRRRWESGDNGGRRIMCHRCRRL